MQRGTTSSSVRGPAQLIVVVAALAASSASAQVTIHVPADAPTIQGAIARAVPGDTVLVAPGTYAEHLDFLGKAITVESSGGTTVTTVDGSATATVVTFKSGEGALSVLRGFTITHGAAIGSPIDGGGIAIASSSPTIEGNLVTANQACAGAGISISFGSPIVRNNTISHNSQSFCSGGTGGGGIQIVGASSAQILGNVISGNSTGSDGGGIALFAAGTPVIRGNTISGNNAGSQGGGISMFNQSDADITDNVIVGNSGARGGGIGWLLPAGRGPFVVNNTIVDNVGADGASGIYADGIAGTGQISNNIVVAAPGQNAIVCDSINTTIAPIILSNDVLAAAPGQPYGGLCAGRTGTSGNVSVDPLFVNHDGGDFHPQLTSPVIDAGTNAAAALPALDRDGNSRIIDGNDDCVATVDMGAYEVFLAPALTIAPASIAFADQLVGTASVAQAVTLTNPSAGAVRICATAVSGDFAQTSHCGPTLAAGASCTIDIQFAPVRVGARAGSISATDPAANGPQAVPLSGNGIEPPIVITPGSATVPPRGARAFAVSGGSGLGFGWSFAVNASGGTLDALSGAYLAGPVGSVVDVLSVVDSFGGAAQAQVSVTAGLAIAPASLAVPPLGHRTFTGSGGSGTGFTWSLVANASGGSIDPGTGAYAAGPTGGVLDVVALSDSLGSTAQVVVGVSPGVSITPSKAGVAPLGSRVFTASGGSGTGFAWSLVANRSGAGIDAVSGTYVAGATPGVTDVIEAVDSLGNAALATITVSGTPVPQALAVVPAAPTISPRARLTFIATGGSGGYTWSLSANASGGSVEAATGAYAAGNTGIVVDVVQVKDSSGATATAHVTVTAGLTINPPSASVAPGGTASFSVSGGSGQGYTWTIASGPSGGIIDRTGAYAAGSRGGVTDVISVADSLGSMATASVTVTGGSEKGGCSQGGAGGCLALLLGAAAAAPRMRSSRTRGVTAAGWS
jgi:parallel beta-helix repeat protein